MSVDAEYAHAKSTGRADKRIRLCRGLAVVPMDGGLVVEGAPYRHVFRGRAATNVLPRLLRLLDGSRDTAELRAELRLTQGQLAKALGLLEDRGLLEIVEEPVGPHSAASPQAVTYFSRNLSGTGSYSGTGQLLTVLAEAVVLLGGDPAMTERMAQDLHEAGVGEVLVGGPPQWTTTSTVESAARRVAVVVDQPGAPETLAEIVVWCGPRGIPVLRVSAQAGHIEIGPGFLPGVTACPACLWKGRVETGWADGAVIAGDDAQADFLAGFGVNETLAIVTRSRSVAMPRTITRISLADWSTETRLVSPYAGCPDCDSGAVDASPSATLVDLYEWSGEDPPECFRGGRWQPEAELVPIARMRRRRPEFATHPRLPLTVTSHEAAGTFGTTQLPIPSRGIDLSLLADLMRRVGGYRDVSADDRWTPNGGNMASVEMYLITEAGVPELPGTIFRYGDIAHELIAVRPDPIPVSRFLAGTGLEAGPGDAVLVMVAAHGRLAVKYPDFAHRLAHLDAGCATTQLAVLAGALGLGTDFAPRWDERLANMLDLVQDDQFVTAVAVLRQRNAEGDTSCP